MKWDFCRKAKGEAHYVVCNADEGEPGTFKDREILYDLPHLVLEGMALAARCVGASRGWVFIRHEYAPERQRLEAALEEARALGALGRGVTLSAVLEVVRRIRERVGDHPLYLSIDIDVLDPAHAPGTDLHRRHPHLNRPRRRPRRSGRPARTPPRATPREGGDVCPTPSSDPASWP